MSGGSASEDMGSWAKQSGRARVYAFFWAFVVVAIANTISEENDIFLHVVDDYSDIVLAIVALAVLAFMWRKKSPQSLKMANNVAAVLAVLLILATVFAITQEINDPTDFGNEIPTLLFGVFMVVNRFL